MPKQRPRRTPVRAISAPELCDRYAHLYTAVITDVLDKRGCYEQTLPRDITGLTPETPRRRTGLSGKRQGHPQLGYGPSAPRVPCHAERGAAGRGARRPVERRRRRRALRRAGGSSLARARRTRRGDRGRHGISPRAAHGLSGCCAGTERPWTRATLAGRGVGAAGDDWRVRVEPGEGSRRPRWLVAVPKALAVPVLLECEDLSHAENQVRDAVKTGMGPWPPTRSSAFSEQRAGKLASPRR